MRITLRLGLSLGFLFFGTSLIAKPLPSAAMLDWVASSDHSQCGGYFRESCQDLAPVNTQQLYADEGDAHLNHNHATLRGHVRLTTPTHQVTADRAFVERSKKTGKFERVKAWGKIRVCEPGRLLLGEDATVDLLHNKLWLNHATYRIALGQHKTLSAWGSAEQIQALNQHHVLISNASYSTCPPHHPQWHLEAQSLTLDKSKGRGVAKKAVLFIKEKPLLYIPYISFPTDKRRKSGLLLPSVSYGSKEGFRYQQPIYWNIADNKDATIEPAWISKRGWLLNAEARYLSTSTIAQVNASYIPRDRLFAEFLKENPTINKVDPARAAIHFDSHSIINTALRTQFQFNGVSDDYFLQDFHQDLATINARQLLRNAEIDYQGEMLKLNAKMQQYQTLQPLGQNRVAPVHALLPQITVETTPIAFKALDVGIYGQYTHFNNLGDPLLVNAERLTLAPFMRLPLESARGYFIPSITAHTRYYTLKGNAENGLHGDTLSIPIFSIDTGLRFERNVASGHQTLEPRAYYLYIPYHDQDHLPLLDSGQNAFDYAQLWRNNRFSGDDRLNDTHHLALGLSSSWRNMLGREVLRAGIGVIRYLQTRHVLFCQGVGCSDGPFGKKLEYHSPTARTSPIVGTLEWNQTPHWHLHSTLAWDPAQSLDYTGLELRYQPAPNKLVNFAYRYQPRVLTYNTDGRFGIEKDHLIGASAVLPLYQDWQWLASFSYNLARRHAQTVLVGSQYDSCCWAVRLIASRTLSAASDTTHEHYTNSVYVQLLLKGLGGVSSKDPSLVLTNDIPGYHDDFFQRGIL